MVAAVSRVQPVEYAEIVATVASQLGGPGHAPEHRRVHPHDRRRGGVASAARSAERRSSSSTRPSRRSSCATRSTASPRRSRTEEAITESVHAMVKEVQRYVPGYALKNGPVFDGRRVRPSWRCRASAITCPKYAGNLDIMTAAAAADRGDACAGDPGWRLRSSIAEGGSMNLRGKSVTLHDMSLRDGMHPKRHRITARADDRRRDRRSTRRACRSSR